LPSSDILFTKLTSFTKAYSTLYINTVSNKINIPRYKQEVMNYWVCMILDSIKKLSDKTC